MTINNKFSFECAVQSLARVLAQIKPTPWEKVSLCVILSLSLPLLFLIKCVLQFGQIDKIDFCIASTEIRMKFNE